MRDDLYFQTLMSAAMGCQIVTNTRLVSTQTENIRVYAMKVILELENIAFVSFNSDDFFLMRLKNFELKFFIRIQKIIISSVLVQFFSRQRSWSDFEKKKIKCPF